MAAGMRASSRLSSRRAFGRVLVEQLGEHVRLAEGWAMAALDRVGLDPEPVSDQWPQPPFGEETVIPAEHEARRDLGPPGQWPWLPSRRLGLPSPSARGL